MSISETFGAWQINLLGRCGHYGNSQQKFIEIPSILFIEGKLKC